MKKFRSRALMVLFGFIVVLVLGALLLPMFFVAYAHGFIARSELDLRQRHVQFAYEVHLAERGPVDPDFAANKRRAILEQMLTERLLIREAGAQALPPKEEQESYVKEVIAFLTREYFGASRESLENGLADAGLTMADLESYLADTWVVYELRQVKLKGIVVTDAEIKARFEARRAEYALPEMIRLRHIVVPTPALAETLRRQLERGADFAALARQHTVDVVSRPLGGDLNWRTRGEFSAAFEEAAWALDSVGSISPVVKTEMGYHLIKLEGQLPPRERTLAEVQDAVREHLREEREAAFWTDYLREVRRRRAVFIFLR